MCTVTFIARKRGFALGMNRDEQLARVTARPPAIQMLAGRRALFPSEPGGGTWIGVNDTGTVCALINWYAIPARVGGSPVSRGRVVTNALTATDAPQMERSLKEMPLDRVNPFRLIGVFPDRRHVVEWRWNLRQLTAFRRPWRTATWISSGFDEPGAQVARSKTFAAARHQATSAGLPWLRRLHRSHQPAPGPYSICMHRDDAATVSYTEIVVSPATAVIRYRAGPPCENGPLTTLRLDRDRSAPAARKRRQQKPGSLGRTDFT